MKNIHQQVDVIVESVEELLRGEPLPSIRNPQSRVLLDALLQSTSGANAQRTCELVGTAVLRLLVQHASATFQGEHELERLLRQGSRPV